MIYTEENTYQGENMAELSDFTSEISMPFNEHEPKKARTKSNLDYALPGKSCNFETHHKQILLAYLLESKRGQKELIYTDFSQNSLGFSPNSLSGNNKFFESVGLLEKGSKNGYYRLTPDGIRLAEFFYYQKTDEGKKLLGDLIRKSWIYETAKKLLTLKSSVSIEDLIKELAHASKAELPKHKSQLQVLIDYLVYIGAIEIDDDNKILLISQFEAPELINPEEVSELDVSKNLIENGNGSNIENKEISGPSVNASETKDKTISGITTTESSSSGRVTINVDLSIKLEITPEMTPEDVQGKLDAIVASLKNMD